MKIIVAHTPKYLPTLKELDALAYEHTWSDDNWDNHPDRAIAAWRGLPVGFIAIRDKVIRRLGVSPGFRRLGIASRLILASGAKVMNVCEMNLPCQLLLKKAGFTCTRIIEHGPTAGRNGFLMEKIDDSSSRRR